MFPTADIRNHLKLQLRHQGRDFERAPKRVIKHLPTVSAQFSKKKKKATQVQHKQVKKYHGTCMYTDTTGEKYGTKHTEDEEPYLDKNRTKETGNFQLVFNTVVEINQNIYSITQES